MTLQPNLLPADENANQKLLPAGSEPASVDTEQTGGSVARAAKSWIAVTAMGAGLVLGVLLAGASGIGTDIRAGDMALFAQGSLAQRLTGEVSGAAGIGPSFWSREGTFCRVYTTGNPERAGLSGIACRETGGWRIKIVAVRDSGGVPAPVRSVMENLIVGGSLDRAAEQQARRQAWRAE